jgi:hypothetical protein
MTGSARVESELNNLQQIEVRGKSFKTLAKNFLQARKPSS